MTKQEFIGKIAVYVQKYAPSYGIKICSPIIAQAILESASGTSELAVNANNFFGLKYKIGRCPTASGVYYKNGSEQNADGSYSVSAMQWCKFDDMEDCVVGYFDFTNIPRYANLKGVTDPLTYLQNIKADGYATSLKYVDNLMNVINTYNLTQYDVLKETEKTVDKTADKVSRKIKVAIDAGHGLNTSGKRVTLSGYAPTREWWLNDRIADMVQKELTEKYGCVVLRVDDTTGAKDIPLSTRVRSANNANVDMYISIHHNAGINGGTGGGTVVYYYSSKQTRRAEAQRLYNSITDETKLYGNRCEQVTKKKFYVLANTRAKAYLIENGFMDSQTDVPIIITEKHAKKTAEGIVSFLAREFSLEAQEVAEKGTHSATEASVYFPKYKGAKTTLHTAMQSLGIYASYKHRKAVAKANGITAYIGSAKQNIQMYNLLVAGLLKKP